MVYALELGQRAHVDHAQRRLLCIVCDCLPTPTARTAAGRGGGETPQSPRQLIAALRRERWLSECRQTILRTIKVIRCAEQISQLIGTFAVDEVPGPSSRSCSR